MAPAAEATGPTAAASDAAAGDAAAGDAVGDTEAPDIPARQRWMAALARAPRARLDAAWAALDPPPAEVEPLRPAEIGTAMVQARAGGTGARFHLGETTVTRCAVAIRGADGQARVGHAYVAGRDRGHAELAACFDALLQDPARRETLEAALVGPLLAEQERARVEARRRAAASRVDFFTLVRGE